MVRAGDATPQELPTSLALESVEAGQMIAVSWRCRHNSHEDTLNTDKNANSQRDRQRQLSTDVPLQDPDVLQSQIESADTHSRTDTHTHSLAQTHLHQTRSPTYIHSLTHTHTQPLSQLHSTTLRHSDATIVFLGALSKSQRSGKEHRMRAEEEGGRKGKERRAESGDREVFKLFFKSHRPCARRLPSQWDSTYDGRRTDTFGYLVFSDVDIFQTWIHTEPHTSGYTAKKKGERRRTKSFSRSDFS